MMAGIGAKTSISELVDSTSRGRFYTKCEFSCHRFGPEDVKMYAESMKFATFSFFGHFCDVGNHMKVPKSTRGREERAERKTKDPRPPPLPYPYPYP
jgi:hypothetical protein